MTGEVNNIDDHVTMVLDQLEVEVWEFACKDLSDFYNGQIMMSVLVNLQTSRACEVFLVCNGQSLPIEVQDKTDWPPGSLSPRLSDACGEQRLASLV